MKYVVNLSDEANADLREIFHYIAIHLQAPENAVSQLQHVWNNISEGLMNFRTDFGSMRKVYGRNAVFVSCQWIAIAYFIYRMMPQRQLRLFESCMAEEI